MDTLTAPATLTIVGRAQPCGGPLMIRRQPTCLAEIRVFLPHSVWDLARQVEPGYHVVPTDWNWDADPETAPVILFAPDDLHVIMTYRPGPKPRWTPAEIREWREEYWFGGNVTIPDLAKRLHTAPQNVANFLTGKTYWWA